MTEIYRITVCGRTMESRDLKQLLARAVAEKRSMDWRLKTVGRVRAVANRPRFRAACKLVQAGVEPRISEPLVSGF